MPPVTRRLRSLRRRLGLSQAALAHAAGVSVATVQNVEAGRANPALRTLERILAPLGVELDVRPAPADWPALVALGLPLTGPARPGVVRDADTLRRHVARAAAELAREPDAEGAARRRDALHALLLAADRHFPEVTRGWAARDPDVAALLSADPTGRVVKLARIALQRLAEYL